MEDLTNKGDMSNMWVERLMIQVQDLDGVG